MTRDMLFVSHANPEDDRFTLWAALRLAAEGYGVWCDLTKLLGGEDFWSDIEDAIRDRTAKFLFVLSKNSNHKPGSLDELGLARKVQRALNLKEFVLPLWIDSLQASEFNVHLTNVNAISFREGWARGLAQLLSKLEKDGVPRHPKFGPGAVAGWWRGHESSQGELRKESEWLVTNLYPLQAAELHFHELVRSDIGPLDTPEDLPYPAARHNQYLVSFAPATDFTGSLGPKTTIKSTVTRSLSDLASPAVPRIWSYRDERAVFTRLLKQAWAALLRSRGLPTYEFANGAVAFYFMAGTVPSDQLTFVGADGVKSRRGVVGYRTMRDAAGAHWVRYWHFALQGKPVLVPSLGFVMKSHVLFTDDGKTIWADKSRLHRARRSQCKDWWNDRWRDLIAATIEWLALGSDRIVLPVGSATTVNVIARPVQLTSPVSYTEPASLSLGEGSDEREDDEITDLDEQDDAEFEEEGEPDA